MYTVTVMSKWQGALEAFRETTCSLGLPAVHLFYTDNPAGDKQYYMYLLPTLRAQQDVFDALSTLETEQLNLGGKQSFHHVHMQGFLQLEWWQKKEK